MTVNCDKVQKEVTVNITVNGYTYTFRRKTENEGDALAVQTVVQGQINRDFYGPLQKRDELAAELRHANARIVSLRGRITRLKRASR